MQQLLFDVEYWTIGYDSDSSPVILITETQRRQYSGHNTPLGYYTDQGL